METNQLHLIFPEALPTVKSLLLEDLLMIENIQEQHRKIVQVVNKHKKPTDANYDFIVDLAIYGYGYVREAEKRIARVKRLWQFVNNFNRTSSQGPDLSVLRDIPISSFIKIDKDGISKCPFPDHLEKTPSFKYYKKTNSFYCFGCGRGGDSIAFMQYLENISPGAAMKKLSSLLK